MRGNNVETRRARDFLRVVEAHAMQDACAAVMARRIKPLEAERGHHLALTLRHRAERIAGMVLAAGRLFGIAIAAQVGADDGEIARQRWRNFVPRQMIERVAVHQQHRRSRTANHRDNTRALGLDFGASEAVEHAPVYMTVTAAPAMRNPDFAVAKPGSKPVHGLPA